MLASVRRAAPLLAAVLALAASACDRSSGGRYPDFADLVEQASPAVVNISTTVTPGETVAQGSEETPFNEFFRRFFGEGGETPDEGGAPADAPLVQPQSLGSGLILWADGYILTNRHVVRDATEVIVKLSDRRQFPAKLIGTDERSDLALLKIEASGLPAVKIGDVTQLRVGEWVLAIGSPFGFDYSVTAGIVSAKGRALPNENYVPFLQTDVAINPGNSGGPLFNVRGEVVGVNSQIFSQTGGYMGVSFAIPIDVAAKVAQQLKDTGKVSRGWLGVVVQEVTRDLAQSFGLERPEGALVARVVPGGPGEQSGVLVGDVILSFEGHDIPLSSALPPMVGNTDPGTTVSLKILREGKAVTVKVVVGTLEPEPASEPQAERPPQAVSGTHGIVVRSLTPEERTRAQIVSGGAMVLEVQDGPGRDAGLLPGDILLTISGNEIDSPQRLAEVIGRLTPGRSFPLLVQRRGQPTFLALDVPPAGSDE
ncbi:MAG TPA: DegQ family serine endoprotease [Verrucomicrobiae bacterium]|nr:DegQ family serine endoprotease [Verrucomicrobiae bacterium]